jgi:hypothetical protein
MMPDFTFHHGGVSLSTFGTNIATIGLTRCSGSQIDQKPFQHRGGTKARNELRARDQSGI